MNNPCISLDSLFRYLTLSILLLSAEVSQSQRLQVSDNGRFLMTESGKPFFWLADTAWELFHRCDREEAAFYLGKRAEQGFNVIQAVALAELDGLNTPNPYGHLPLIDNDPEKPNEKYFEHVDFIIKQADELGLYVALLPTWGDKVFTHSWGVGPEVFDAENAYAFGQWIGSRYKEYDNIIWVLGGDRNPRPNSNDVQIWNQMAEGIANACGGYDQALMTFHPQPKEEGGSSTWFHDREWLDFNMHQTGHCPNRPTYDLIGHDYLLQPVKPVLDGEPLYEEIPNCFNAKELGYSNHEDIRRIMYWNVFAGAFGQSYGCHDVWQMYKNDKEPVIQPLRPWPKALELPMANQARHLKNLMLSRPYFSRIPDPSMIKEAQEKDNGYIVATRCREGSYAMVYFPMGGQAILDMTSLSKGSMETWWYDPRTGNSFKGKTLERGEEIGVEAPTSGMGHDWVLVIDKADRNFNRPGTPMSY